MPKTAPRSLLPAALLSVLVGLAGCQISFGSGSSSQSPDGVHGKPANRSSSKPGRATKPTSKPASKKSASKPVADANNDEPTREPVEDKTSEGPHRDQPTTTNDPKRTKPTTDPKRTTPTTEPTRTPKHIGGRSPGDGGGEEDEGGAGANTLDRPGSVVAPGGGDGGGANEIERPTTVVAPR